MDDFSNDPGVAGAHEIVVGAWNVSPGDVAFPTAMAHEHLQRLQLAIGQYVAVSAPGDVQQVAMILGLG